jgi:hypothetical protein
LKGMQVIHDGGNYSRRKKRTSNYGGSSRTFLALKSLGSL